MIIESIWLTKLILAHLLSDFILQPKSWVADRNEKHFGSGKLYLHGLVTFATALLMIGWQYWSIALIIVVTHVLIDAWKSYQQPTSVYFILDQLLHLLVITTCWYFTFFNLSNLQLLWQHINVSPYVWKVATAFVFVTFPAGILIGELTKKWSNNIKADPTDNISLVDAGKWIGIMERVIILIFVLKNEYGAIGLLIAAKSIIRFNEKDRPEIKTEYLVIGTLMSIGLVLITGLTVKFLQ
jgi:hypothetical protein